MMLTRLLLIAAGGAIGTLARYGTGLVLARWSDRAHFPIGTLLVNLVGCFLVGLLGGLFSDRWIVRDDIRLACLIGFLGGFTTFSTFGWETTMYLRESQFGKALMYVIVSNVIGIAAVIAGFALSRLRMG